MTKLSKKKLKQNSSDKEEEELLDKNLKALNSNRSILIASAITISLSIIGLATVITWIIQYFK